MRSHDKTFRTKDGVMVVSVLGLSGDLLRVKSVGSRGWDEGKYSLVRRTGVTFTVEGVGSG